MENKLLIITGASRGIGKATAQLFLDQGYEVLNCSRTDPELESVQHFSVDLSNIDWLEPIKQLVIDKARLASEICIIHNAGLLLKDSLSSIEPLNFQKVMQVNVIAASQLNRLLFPYLQKKSSIIFVGSTLSEKGVANTCSYVAAKHAVVGLMRATCQDLKGKNVHATCICPGFTKTDMLLDHIGHSEEVISAISGNVLFERLIEPEEIAKFMLFAAQNPVVNGSVLHANLGQLEN